jgi:hypothetical protein
LLTNNLAVVYPQGAGGMWLRGVIRWCSTRSHWGEQQVNFHQIKFNSIQEMHEYPPVDQALSISDSSCKYNFWALYVLKRFAHELEYTRERGQRLVLSPYVEQYNIQTNRDHFFWVLNQCRYIQSYNWNGRFEIKWRDLFENPVQVWDTICEFLEVNNQKNYRRFDDFITPLTNYKNTCACIKPKINFKQKHFLIWSLASLQHQEIPAPFDIFENFGNKIMLDWIKSYETEIIEFTRLSLYDHNNIV